MWLISASRLGSRTPRRALPSHEAGAFVAKFKAEPPPNECMGGRTKHWPGLLYQKADSHRASGFWARGTHTPASQTLPLRAGLGPAFLGHSLFPGAHAEWQETALFRRGEGTHCVTERAGSGGGGGQQDPGSHSTAQERGEKNKGPGPRALSLCTHWSPLQAPSSHPSGPGKVQSSSKPRPRPSPSSERPSPAHLGGGPFAGLNPGPAPLIS